MKYTSVFSALLVGAGMAVVTTSANSVAAITFGFENIPTTKSNELSGDNLASSFSFDVTAEVNSKIRFLFSNNVGVKQSAAIKQVAFSFAKEPKISKIPPLLDKPVANSGNVGNVNFEVDKKPKNLSQSIKISGWLGEVITGSTKGGNSNSVQHGEKLSFDFVGDYNKVIAALNNRSLLVGIHVGSIGIGGSSDSFVSIPNGSQQVPEPITMLGLGVGAVGAGLLKQKYGKKANKEKVKA